MIGLFVIFIFIFFLAVKCPAIYTDRDVTALGNTEEGSYGQVIQFECVSSDKKIDGSSDIHCEVSGKWSDAVPKCKGSVYCLFFCLSVSMITYLCALFKAPVELFLFLSLFIQI